MHHNLSYIHPDAKIGKNVTIEPFAVIYGDVVIGDDTWIGPNSTIMDGARIGKNCKIFPSAVVSAIPQDLKFQGEITTAEIGDNTTIRECATINRGTKAKNKTVVGSDCLIMAYSHIAHDCIIGNRVIIGNGTQLAGEVEIDNWAILSAHVLVHQFVRIGEHVMISGGSHIKQDVPPFITAAHEPLAYAGINLIGLKRRNFDLATINLIHDIYRIIYQSGINTTEALNKIENEFKIQAPIDYIIDFIKKSTRGIIKNYQSIK